MTDQNKLLLYKQIKKYNPVIIITENPNNIISLKQINMTLLKLGYNARRIYNLLSFYNYCSLDEALNFLSTNKSKHNHEYFLQTDPIYNSICGICEENIYSHHLFENENLYDNNENLNENNNQTYYINNKNENEIQNENIQSKNNLLSRQKLYQSMIFSQYDTNKQALASFQQKNNLISSSAVKTLCRICYKDKHIEINICSCEVKICEKCIMNYINIEKSNNKSKSIACPSCVDILSDEIVKTYSYQEASMQISIKTVNSQYESCLLSILNQPHPTHIPCNHINCNNKISLSSISSNIAKCKNNHFFCIKCKLSHTQIEKCSLIKKEKELNNDPFYRMCFNCGDLINYNKDNSILSENSFSQKKNKFICQKCSFTFCKFCNERADDNHFSFMNMKGCALSSSESIFFKSFGFFLVFFLFIFRILLNIFFGAAFEYPSYVYNYYITKENTFNKKFNGSYRNSITSRSSKTSKKSSKGNGGSEKVSKKYVFLYIILFFSCILGIITQPIYIIYKLFDLVIEGYKFSYINYSFYDENFNFQ